MKRNRFLVGPLLVLLLVAPAVSGAAELLDQVPRDALGFAVVHNLSQADARAGKVLAELGSRLPGPLALLKSAAGLDAGLDLQRDLLVVLLPAENNSRQYELALWLPIQDYDALVRSLDGDPQRRISAITLAGEDLLVARQGDWAVVMDTDQHDRLEQLRDAVGPTQPRLAQWTNWIAANDAAVVVLPAGMRTAWAQAAAAGWLNAPAAKGPTPSNQDDLFGVANETAQLADLWQVSQDWIRSTLAASPELARWAAEAEGAACGLKLDDDGNVVVSVRLALPSDALQQTSNDRPTGAAQPPRLYDGGAFVVVATGQVSSRWAVPAVAPYVGQVTSDLDVRFGSKVDQRDVAEFRKSAEQAVAEVTSASVLTRPGSDAEGVFTNSFLALGVDDSRQFLQRADRLVELWNAMVAKNDGSKLLVFDSTPVSISNHKGTEYSIDMTKAVGVPVVPEIKTSMEKLFGPGGAFRLQFVALDEHTVLLAAATKQQTADVIGVYAAAATAADDPAELRHTAVLLATRGQWRLFASPHGYSQWLRRQMDAILGAVIGGPIVPAFHDSPPVGLVGGSDGQTIWVEAALPAKTIREYGKFSRK
jgi:hypothetical protein